MLSNQKKPNNRVEMEEYLKDTIKDIRIDGLPNVLMSDLLVFKIMWIVVFLCSSSFCFFLVHSSFVEFFKYQVTTNLRLVSESKSTFPTISFYNMNPLNTDYYVDLLKEANITTLDPQPYYNEILLEYQNKLNYGRYLNLTEKKAMFDIEGFIISCTFQNKPCNMSNFRYVFNPWLLSCLQFNSGFDSDGNPVELLKADVGGRYNELTIEFYLGLPNPLVDLISKRGVQIFLHNNSEYPFKNSPSPLVVTPGFGLSVTAQRTLYNQYNEYPYSYNTCNVEEDNRLLVPLDDTYLFEATLAAGYTYSQDTCFIFCFQLYNSQICNCSDHWITFQMPDFDKCNREYQTCANDLYYQVFNTGDFIMNYCSEKCPLECHQEYMYQQQSFYKYPEEKHLEVLKRNEMLLSKYANESDFEYNLASNVAKVTIYYDTLTYSVITEEPKVTWIKLVGNLGGHFHLFLGISFMSVMEIVELLVQIMLYAYLRAKNRSLFHLKSHFVFFIFFLFKPYLTRLNCFKTKSIK